MNKKLFCLMCLAFINVVGIALPYPVVSPLVLKGQLPTLLGFSPLMTVMIVLSLYPLGQFFGSPVMGAYADKLGARWVVVVSMGLTALGYLASAFALYQSNIILLCVTRFFTGFAEGNFGVLRAEVARLSKSSKERIRYFGYFHAAAGTGWVLGPLLGSVLSNSKTSFLFTPHTPFILGSAMGLLGIILALLALQDVAQETKEKVSILQSLTLVWKIPGLSSMLIFSFLITLAVDGFYEFYPTFLIGVLKGGSQEIANNTIFLVVSIIFSQIFVVPRLPSGKKLSFLLPSLLMVLSMFGLAKGESSSMIALSFVLSGLGIGVLTTLVPALVSENTPRDLQGTVMGSMASLRNLGDFIVCLGFGLLGGWSVYLPLALIAAVIFLAAEAFARISQKQKRTLTKGSC